MDSPNTDLGVFTRQVSHQETNPTTGATSPCHSSSHDKGKARATEVVQGAAEQLTRQEQSPARWSMLTPEDYNTSTRPKVSDRALAIREQKRRDRAAHLAAEETAIRASFRETFGRQVKAEAKAGAKHVKEKWCAAWGIKSVEKAARVSGTRAYDEAQEAKIVERLGKGVWPWNEDGQRPDANGTYACAVRRAQPSDNKADAPVEAKDEAVESSFVSRISETKKTADIAEIAEVLDVLEVAPRENGSSKAVSTPPITRWGRPDPPRSPLSHKASIMPLDLPGRQDE